MTWGQAMGIVDMLSGALEEKINASSFVCIAEAAMLKGLAVAIQGPKGPKYLQTEVSGFRNP